MPNQRRRKTPIDHRSIPHISFGQMNPQTTSPAPTESKGKFHKATAEGLMQHKSSGRYYARIMHKGKRILQALGANDSPCTTLPEARRLLRDKRTELERTDVVASKKTLKALIA